MNCAYCSTPVPADATYCQNCGSLVSDAEGQAGATAAIDQSSEERLERLLRAETRGEFEIERMLGKGGMAIVYLATEVHLMRKVAIKVLPPELTFGHGVERFKREARTAAALDHPHIIPIHRIASGGTLFWYTMKYLEGRSLDQYLKETPWLSLDETIRILDPVAQALEYAHEHQVIHRDIKPANVMLDTRDRVVVTDFGIAKALTEGTLTASGSVIGTPFYMSPEQGMGKPVTGASDQYSVAVMAYRMLAGQVPFEGDSAIDILHKHCKEPPPPLDVIRPGLPEYVYKAIDKGLAKKPEDRFSSVTALVAGLRAPSPEIWSEMLTVEVDSDPAIQDKISTKVMAVPSEPKAPSPLPGTLKKPKRNARVMALAVGAVLIGVVTGVLILNLLPDTGPSESSAAESSLETQGAQRVADPGEPVPAVPQQGPTTAEVVVTELPEGGEITVDGVPQAGPTFQLEPGTYHLRITAPGRHAVETPITIAAGSRLMVPFTGPSVRPTTGAVRITNLPRDGVVTVDGRRQQGSEFDLAAGRHSVQMAAPGYHPVDRQIDVTAGTEVSLAFDGLAVVASVSVTPARSQVATGDQVRLRARPVDAGGTVLGDRSVRWESEQPSIAEVAQDGTVTGVASGTATVTANVEGRSARAEITVTAIPVASVTVDPATSALSVGGTARPTAATFDSQARPLSGREVTWRSSDPSVAAVSADGVVRALRAGSANITAQSEGQTGSATISVESAAPVGRPALRQPGISERQPAKPPATATWNPDRLFSREPTGEWTRGPAGGDNVLATYVHRDFGNIRVIDLRTDRAATNPGVIVQNLRRLIESRFSSVRAAGEPYEVTTDAGDTVLVQDLVATNVSGLLEERRSIIIAATRNDARALALIGDFEFYGAREQAKQDMLQMIRSLN